MAKTSLTDMQRVILSNAAMRMDHRLLPVPKSLQKGANAVALSIRPLLSRGLVSEVQAERDDVLWREDAASGRTALIITRAGMAAIGVTEGETGEVGEAHPGDRLSKPAGVVEGGITATEVMSASERKAPRDGSKLALLIEILSQPHGATIPDIMEVTGWQAHSVRGAISGALKRQLGLTVISTVTEGRGRVYRIATDAALDTTAARDVGAANPSGDAPTGAPETDDDVGDGAVR